MKTLILLFAFVAAASCTECGPLQKLKVKQQWSVAFGTDHHRIDFGIAIWRGLFRQEPEARKMFKRVHGDDLYSGAFRAHSMRVLGGLNMIISAIDNDDIAKFVLDHLHEDHIDRHVPGNYFQAMKNVLMKVIPAAIGRCFDHDAWEACMDVILDGIQGH